MRNNNRSSRNITYGGIIAALYIILTAISNSFGLASGMIQLRLSEALCILPCFLPEAIAGIAIGCLISNILTGAILWDVVFGTLATILGALGTYKLRANRWLAALPPIAANTIIIPIVLSYGYGIEQGFWIMVFTVGIGEFVSVFVFGELLYSAINKRKVFR